MSISQWVLTIVTVAGAAAIVMLALRNRSLAARAVAAERRFDLLQHLVPSLTDAVTDSTAATCARILDRLGVFVPSQTMLCFYIDDGRLVLGARAGDGYARFLREGSSYEGASIIEMARDAKTSIAVGPTRLDIPADVEVLDASSQPWSDKVGPAAGSRDRVWALAVPLVRSRGRGLSPEVIGVLYVERVLDAPFAADDLRTVLTVARLASDSLERARFADVVRRDSSVDGLTGLMTPIAFRKRLRDEVAAKRDLALFFVDTDRFKLYNDTFGHAAGDRLLRSLAALFGDIADKSGGFAGRNGGDEFCIALVDRTKDAAVEIAERVRANVDATGFGEAVKITVSIGVAHYPVDVPSDDRQPADRLLEVADGLMYEAKRSGRNRIEFLRFRAQPRYAGHPGEGPIPRR
ncbi:MAG TPA: GGDEF domain-containing protein [Candidatus Eremiobacteraceae bacterium]|nr:GGDEF domain-containing protein [Candidatus Eremiobacteraceae bacterium]